MIISPLRGRGKFLRTEIRNGTYVNGIYTRPLFHCHCSDIRSSGRFPFLSSNFFPSASGFIGFNGGMFREMDFDESNDDNDVCLMNRALLIYLN